MQSIQRHTTGYEHVARKTCVPQENLATKVLTVHEFTLGHAFLASMAVVKNQ